MQQQNNPFLGAQDLVAQLQKNLQAFNQVAYGTPFMGNGNRNTSLGLMSLLAGGIGGYPQQQAPQGGFNQGAELTITNNISNGSQSNAGYSNTSSSSSKTTGGPRSRPNLVELQILIDMTQQRFKVYLNRNCHRTMDQYYTYLSSSLNLSDPQTLLLAKEIPTMPGYYLEIKDTQDIVNHIDLILSRRGRLRLFDPNNTPQQNPIPQPTFQSVATAKPQQVSAPSSNFGMGALQQQSQQVAIKDDDSADEEDSIEVVGVKPGKPQKHVLTIEQIRSHTANAVPDKSGEQQKQNLKEIMNKVREFNSKSPKSKGGSDQHTGTTVQHSVGNFPSSYYLEKPFSVNRISGRKQPPLPKISNENTIDLRDTNGDDEIKLDESVDPGYEKVTIVDNGYLEAKDEVIQEEEDDVVEVIDQRNPENRYGGGMGQSMGIGKKEDSYYQEGGFKEDYDMKGDSFFDGESRVIAGKRTYCRKPMGKPGFLRGPYISTAPSAQVIRHVEATPGKMLVSRNEYELDQVYTKMTKLYGFIPWEPWVPMPYPHRELSIVRQNYTRGDKLQVQTPDFVDFANDLKGINSRNQLIYRAKRMMLERGIRANLQFAGTGEAAGLQIVIMCAKSIRMPVGYKGPIPRTTCPFVMHFSRKSAHFQKEKEQSAPDKRRIKKKLVTLTDTQVDEFDNEEFIFKAPAKYLRGNEDDSQYFENMDELGFRLQSQDRPLIFNIVSMNAPSKPPSPRRNGNESSGTESEDENAPPKEPPPLEQPRLNVDPNGVSYIHPVNKFSKMLEDMIIEGDPYYLQKYRSVHNHDIDTNLIVNEALVMEHHVSKKGAVCVIPQACVAMQEHCSQRRREICDDRANFQPKIEGGAGNIQNFLGKSLSFEECVRMHEKMKRRNDIQANIDEIMQEQLERIDEFDGVEFEQVDKATTIYKVDPGDPEFDQHYQIRIIEPLGMTPFFLLVDMTPYDDFDVYGPVIAKEYQQYKQCQKPQKWPPLGSQVKHCFEKVYECYYKILDQVQDRFDRGIYNLDRYRRAQPPRISRPGMKRDPFDNSNDQNNNILGRHRRGRRPNPQIIKMVSSMDRRGHGGDDLINSDDEGAGNFFKQFKDSMLRDGDTQLDIQGNVGQGNGGESEEDDNNYSIYN